jgi:hypothetical protein
MVLGALSVGILAGPAAARTHKVHYTKAQKAKIRAQLRRAVKKNPKVVTTRGFLKKASIVNFTLPATIRLAQATDQFNHFAPNTANKATLDLGPSLGSRSIGLGGKLSANIQFNDAYDSGHIGDVKLSIPAGGNITSTSVPLLTNTNTSNPTYVAPELELFKGVVVKAGGTFTLTQGADSAPISVAALDPTSATDRNTLTGLVKTAVGGFAGTGGASNISVAVTDASAALGQAAFGLAVQWTGAKKYTNVTDLVAGGSIYAPATGVTVQGDPGYTDAGGNQGCAGFAGDGTASDVDALSKMSTSLDPGVNNVGDGPYSPEAGATQQDVVLRTGPLSLSVDDPAGGSITLPNGSVQDVGPSGGRANLFGSPVNGGGDSVDVTVNLATDINSIARQVDGAFPGPAGGGGTAEKNGNISSYFNCRQAWTGKVENHLTGIKLAGGLHISPAITADGKLRIAKVNLATPSGQAAKVAVAACLAPYQLFAAGKTGIGDSQTVAPNLPLGNAALFNPLAAADTDNVSAAPTADCNATGGPLNRDPFNVSPIPGSDVLTNGSEVVVSGDLSVEALRGEVLIGNV